MALSPQEKYKVEPLVVRSTCRPLEVEQGLARRINCPHGYHLKNLEGKRPLGIRPNREMLAPAV